MTMACYYFSLVFHIRAKLANVGDCALQSNATGEGHSSSCTVNHINNY